MNYQDYALIFKGLSDSTRVEIVDLLKEGTMCGCKILEKFKITQPTLSYHMKALVECQLVTVKKEGVWNYYSINNKILSSLKEFL